MSTFRLTIAGAKFRGAEILDRLSSDEFVGEEVTFEAEPTNKFDPRAVRILIEDNEGDDLFVGYVPRTDTGTFHDAWDLDLEVTAKYLGHQAIEVTIDTSDAEGEGGGD